MPVEFVDDASATGNSEQDWEIFDVLCKEPIDPGCGDHLSHSIDLVTTLRSELAAANYKRERLANEISQQKSTLCAMDAEAEQLRAQSVRQTTLITSLQTRLQAVEQREKGLQAQHESTCQTMHREQRTAEARLKELSTRVRRLESDLAAEEAGRESTRTQLHDLIRRLCLCLAVDVCDASHLTAETVLQKSAELVAEQQRLRVTLKTTNEALHACESDLLAAKTAACSAKQQYGMQLDAAESLNKELDGRARQAEREVQMTRDRLADAEVGGNKLRSELHGFELRCSRLQDTIDRVQNDRLQFLRALAAQMGVAEPCETQIREKVRDICSELQLVQGQVVGLREQLAVEAGRHREATDGMLRAEEAQKRYVEERLKEAHQELQAMRGDHCTLIEFLVRLSRVLDDSTECKTGAASRPENGREAAAMAEALLLRAERLMAAHQEHHHHSDKCHLPAVQHHQSLKLRRERSCHDIPLKESNTPAIYTLQQRVRVLREQVQRRDLHLELVRRKLAHLEESVRGKCVVQNERDDAMQRARRSSKNAEKTAQQLIEAKSQLVELKRQLSEAIDYKIMALERARKIDELQSRLAECEQEKVRLAAQVSGYKNRARAAVDSSNERCRRDEHNLLFHREEMARMKVQMADTNHRLSKLQAFRASVARFLNLRDVPPDGVLQRLQTLCNEFSVMSRRYESGSPIIGHPIGGCSRYDDLLLAGGGPAAQHCRPISSAASGHHHHRLPLDEPFEDDFEFSIDGAAGVA